MLWPPEGAEYQQLTYKRHELNFSDHRPVSAYYRLTTKVENVQMKEQILKLIYEVFYLIGIVERLGVEVGDER
jgi:hypothetical protein